MRRTRGFTLLEVIVALGVLAIGATAALGLLVAGATAGRRAERHVDAALLAESLISDVRGYPLDRAALDELEPWSPREQDPLAEPAPGADAGAAPPAETRFLARDLERADYPGYLADVLVTPLASPAGGEVWHLLIEVEVRWSERGQDRSAIFSKVVLRTATAADRFAQQP